MDDYHFNNIAKITKKLHLIILGKIKNFNFTNIGNILCNEIKIIQDLMNAFVN
jgi:hypothetical protein